MRSLDRRALLLEVRQHHNQARATHMLPQILALLTQGCTRAPSSRRSPSWSPSAQWQRLGAAVIGFSMLLIATQVSALPALPGFNGVASVLTESPVVSSPLDVKADGNGTVYIADFSLNEIITIPEAGTPSVLNITGLDTPLYQPDSIALDSAGTLTILDSGNQRVVKVSPSGAASLVDISPYTLFKANGLAVDTGGNLYISDSGHNRIIEVPQGGSARLFNISGVGALGLPQAMSFDSAGNLYIADTYNQRVVEVAGAAAGGTAGTVLTITGLGTPIADPYGVTVDNLGGVYISDLLNSRIVHVAADGSGSVVQTGLLGALSPGALAVGVDGTLYVVDVYADQVDAIAGPSVNFGKVSLGATNGTTLALPFSIPNGTTVGSVDILTSGTAARDFKPGPVNLCPFTVHPHACAPINSSCVGVSGGSCFVGVSFLPLSPGLRQGAVVLRDSGGAPIYSVPLQGLGSAPIAAVYPGTASVINTGGVGIPGPFETALDGAGNLYVGAGQVYRIPAGGGTATVVATPGVSVSSAAGVAVDGAGNLFVADYLANRIVVVTPDGAANVLTINNLSTAINSPTSLQFDSAGTLYIDDYRNARVVKVSSLVVTDTSAVGNGLVMSTGSFTFPQFDFIGIAVDVHGSVYIADRAPGSGPPRIVKVDASGLASVLSLPGISLNEPQGIAVDTWGNLYIADSGNQRIIQVTTTGTVAVLAFPGLTLGIYNYSPTVDAYGNLYIADVNNSRIIKLDVGMPAALAFPDTAVNFLSAPLTSNLLNLGDVDLVLSQPPSYPLLFPEDPSVSGRCSGSTVLASAAHCAVAADFAPTTIAAVSGNIVLTDNSLNVAGATQSVPLSGNGTNPVVLSISPSSLVFDPQIVGTLSPAQALTVRNVGAVPINPIAAVIGGANSGDFAIAASSCSGTLAINATCTIDITYSPLAAGMRSATVTLSASDSADPRYSTSQVVSITGSAQQATVSLNSLALDFGQTLNNQRTSRSLTLTNTGTSALVISGLSAPRDFIASPDCGVSVPVGSSCHILIVFAPSTVGAVSGELVITSNASNGTVPVALSGTNLLTPVNGTGGGAVGEDVLAVLAFAAGWRRRFRGRVRAE